jgi:Carboxypeptidase regulatory-like domain
MLHRVVRTARNRRFSLACLFAWWSVALAVIGVVSSTNLAAQAISGDLVGAITDSSGSAVPNATITATNTGTNVKTTTTTNVGGEYRITNLPAGEYDLTASAMGFAASTLKAVTVQLNQTATANLTLQVGEVATTVEVAAAGALIDTTTAQIQNTYSTKQIADLPFATSGTQGVLNLSLLQAGVASNGGVGVGTGPSIGGQRPRNNNFTIEGVDNNDKAVTGPVVYLPNESIAEFTLLQNQFSAEFGHSSGGQFNTIVKSGTNEYHGTLYDYMQNRNLNAIDQTFKNEGIYTLPRYDQNHLGANVGGPILKNKLFFFGSLEYNPLGQASTPGAPVYAPTSAGYSTLASAPGISQTNLGVMQKYALAPAVTAGAPTITVNGVSVPTGIIPIAAPNYQNGYYGVGSVDYNISDSDQLRGRIIFNHTNEINTVADLPVFYTPVEGRYYLSTIAEYHTFDPHLTNEFRLAYQRENLNYPVGNQTFPGLSAFPNLQFNDLNLQIGPNPNYPQGRVDNLYQGIESMNWIHGNHTVKFGTEFRDYISPQLFVQSLRGNYEYTTVANYLLDITPDYYAARAIGGSTYYGNELATYSYIQDTWRARRNLTIDLGLRYEYTTVPVGMQMQKLNSLASVPGLLTFNAPSADPHGFGPRVGIAYTPGQSGNTVIRAGFGIATEVIFDNVGLNTAPPEFYTLVTQTGAGQSNFLANGGITAAQGLTSLTPAAARAATSSYLPNQQTLPYSINWNIGVQHIFAKDYTVEVRYVGTKGVHEILQEQLNRISAVTPTQSIPTFMSQPSLATLASLSLTEGALRSMSGPDPVYSAAGFTNTITAYTPQGYSQYNGLSAQLNRRFARGLQYQVAYTWSHLIDNSTAEVASTYLTPRRPEDFQNIAADKASSALDRRQRFTAAIVYDAPWFGQSRNWFMKNLVGNWEIAPIYTYESPEYFTPQSGVDSNLNGDAAPDRVIVNPSGVAGTGSTVYGLTATGTVVQPTAPTSQLAPIVAYVANNPNARYIEAGPGAYANGGRNLQPIRPIDDIDVSLIKHFRAGLERFRIDLGAQAYNLFNHPQFTAGAIDGVQLTSTATASALSFAQVSNPNFNNPTLPFSSNPRNVKVFARFNW